MRLHSEVKEEYMCVTVYSTTTCGICKALTQWLESKNIPYTKLNVDTDTEAMQQLMQKSGGRIGVPFSVVEYNGRSATVAGFDQKKFKETFAALA
jgi:glutaredoxin